ncbi:MAG: hypothetical protein MRERV_28c020 [Mycoplasmataceae bacterium RV_VA103A]|nr:MAG: hypothetical protein MRERV_28c020 [Mycoplasmataceae bacterium RV_VA103A]
MNNKLKYQTPLIVHCWRCQANFSIPWVFPLKGYPKKNNWGHWTEQEQDKEKYICNICLKDLYLNNKTEFFSSVHNNSKISTLRAYISQQVI